MRGSPLTIHVCVDAVGGGGEQWVDDEPMLPLRRNPSTQLFSKNKRPKDGILKTHLYQIELGMCAEASWP